MNKLYIAVLLLLLPFIVQGQSASDAKWETYLHSGEITSFAETPNEYWIGTKGGLVTIDKSTYEPEYSNKANSVMASNKVESILIDNTGLPWIGTYDGGLVLAKDDGWELRNNSNSPLPTDVLHIVTQSPAGDIYVLHELGVSKLQGNQWTHMYYAQPANWPSRRVGYDLQGNLWFTTSKDIYQIKNNTIIEHTDSILSSYNTIIGLAVSGSGEVYVRIGSNMIKKYSGGIWTDIDVKQLPGTKPNLGEIIADANGKIRLVRGNLLLEENNGSWSSIDLFALGYPEYYIDRVFFDSNNNLLITSKDRLHIYRNNTWTTVPLSNSPLNGGTVRLATEAPGNKVYFFEPSGYLYLNDDGDWYELPVPVTALGYGKFDLEAAPNGILYYTSGADGLFVWNGHAWHNFTTTNSGLPTNSIGILETDANGVLWIGTDNHGLIKFDGSNWVQYTTANSNLIDNNIRVLASDHKGGIWIGTENQHLVHFDGSNFVSTGTSAISTSSSNKIDALAVDGAGNVWVGCRVAPLTKFDGHTFTQYPLAGDYKGNYVSSIAIDQNEKVWVTSGYFGFYTVENEVIEYYTYDSSPLPDDHLMSAVVATDNSVWLSGKGSTNKISNGILMSVTDDLEDGISVYPIPADDQIIISLSAVGEREITLYDLNGKVVRQIITSEPHVKLDISSEAPGIYLIGLKEGPVTQFKQIVIQ